MNNKRRQKLDACKWLLSSISSEAQDVGEQLDSILNLKTKLDEWSSQTNLTLERLQAILDEENGALMSIPDNFLDGMVCYNVETLKRPRRFWTLSTKWKTNSICFH